MRPIFMAVALLATVAAAASSSNSKLREQCEACRKMADKFYDGVATTAKSIHFAGGNREGWTREKEKFLGKYEMHGARLVEIMDGICGHDFQCNALMEDAEAHLEEWWEKRDDEGVAWNVAGLQSWLCVETLKVCCPAGHYGKKCKACPGTDGKVCSGQGSCAGDGLRSGTGKCKCHSHFTGEHCSVCEGGYFKATEGNLCLACDPSCALNCTGPGPAACGECRAGYETVEGVGCVDVDECAAGTASCADGKICVNKPGTHECVTCDTSCRAEAGCSGSTPKDCNECAVGFERDSANSCQDTDECAAFACDGQMTCSNTFGSFNCQCREPAISGADGACELPALWHGLDLRTPVSAPASEGTVELVGDSPSARFAQRWIAFPAEHAVAPLHVVVAGDAVCCGDQFALHASNVSTTGFTLLVARTDKQSGWSQQLRVR